MRTRTRPPAPPKFGLRFLRIFGWVFVIVAAISLTDFVLSYIGEPPEWNRFDRLMDALKAGWLALLHFTIARYEERDQ